MSEALKLVLKEKGYRGSFTLGPLIDACGDKFFSLSKRKKNKLLPWAARKNFGSGWIAREGKTKNEAVGRLLLSILVEEEGR